jgi:steroid delta-isomerase-like uncharacterized protein
MNHSAVYSADDCGSHPFLEAHHMKTPDRAARERTVQEHIDRELRHDLDALVDTFTVQHAEWNDRAAVETHSGHAEIRAHYDDLFKGFPDFSFDVVHKHVSDEAIVLEAVATGTHQADWKGVPATGKSVKFPLCVVFTFAEDDKILAETVYYDRLTVLTQLGVLTS